VKVSPYAPKAKDEPPGKAADAGKPPASEAKK
jgi:hypothetical protein